MAFAARLGSLAEELIEAVTGSSAKADLLAFNTCRDAVLRSLKSQAYLRTNQFEIDRTLLGLEERFRVNDREHLADALQTGLHTLRQHPSKWHPEILELLLELSDQPTSKARVSELDLLRVIDEDTGPPLRWEDIAKEDGWDQDGLLWQTIDYSEESDLDEDLGYDSDRGSNRDSDPSSVPENESAARAVEDYIVHPEDFQALSSVQDAQKWQDTTTTQPNNSSGGAHKITITEVQAVREVLFMLQGLQTSLFDDKNNVVTNFQMEHLAWQTHHALMTTFSEFGRQLQVLRTFVEQQQTVPHLQSFQDSVDNRLGRFDDKISAIQARYASPNDELVVSLVAIKAELEPALEPLFALVRILLQVRQASELETFVYLELLFDEVSIAQASGRHGVFNFLAEIFVECFNVYLRPIRHWMDNGRLIPWNETFFVFEPSENVPLADTWRKKFRLRTTKDGHLYAPKFLRPAATQIYNAGKNIFVLRLFGRYSAAELDAPHDEPALDYDTICPKDNDLAPFEFLFGLAFDRWIQSKYRKTFATLKEALFDDWGLSGGLDAMQHLYLMSNGTASAAFAEHLFEDLDSMNPKWHNHYALTAAGQEAFSSLVDLSRLSIHADVEGQRTPFPAACSSVRVALTDVNIEYRLPWALKLIIPDDSLVHYQSIFTMLLQIRRAQYILRNTWLLENHPPENSNWEACALFYATRNKLVWFNTTLQTYLSTLVLAPEDSKLRQDLAAAQHVDAMVQVHATYLKHVIDQACLGRRLEPIHDAMLDIFDLAIKLEGARSETRQHTTTASPTSDSGDDSDYRSLEEEEASQDELYLATLRDINENFTRHLGFICGGLRSVARATSEFQSSKWDILADMLQTGSGMGI